MKDQPDERVPLRGTLSPVSLTGACRDVDTVYTTTNKGSKQKEDSMFTHVELPTKSVSTKVPSFSTDELDSAGALLRAGYTPSDGEVYSEYVGKRAPRDVAYYKGWYLRAAIAEHCTLAEKQIMVKTWAVDGGYSWALKLKK